jgi:hypothetical protein
MADKDVALGILQAIYLSGFRTYSWRDLGTFFMMLLVVLGVNYLDKITRRKP